MSIQKIKKEIEKLKENNNAPGVDIVKLFGNETAFKILKDLPYDAEIIGSEYGAEYKEYLEDLKQTPRPQSLREWFDKDLMNKIIEED